MSNKQNISKLIQCHNAQDLFNYDLVVDWALDLIIKGRETENILMLASFSKPIDSIEIKPYLSAVLFELGLEEKFETKAVKGKIEYHIIEILESNLVRDNLSSLYDMFIALDCFNNNDIFGLTTFYFLYHAWLELEDIGENYYFEGATLSNIENVLKNEAMKWIEKYSKK